MKTNFLLITLLSTGISCRQLETKEGVPLNEKSSRPQIGLVKSASSSSNELLEFKPNLSREDSVKFKEFLDEWVDNFSYGAIPEFRNDSSLFKERGMDLNTSDTVDVFYGNSNLLSDGGYLDRIFNIKEREATAKGYIYTLKRIGTIDFFCIAFQNSGGARFSLVTYDGKNSVFHILPYFFERTKFFKQYAFVEDEKFIVQLYYEKIDDGKSISEESKLHLREYRRVTEVSDTGDFVIVSENVTEDFFNYLLNENRIEYLVKVKM